MLIFDIRGNLQYYVVHNLKKAKYMHLSYKTAKYKGTIYKSYSIAESYREGTKVKKRIICPIGKLTDIQARGIRLICKAISDPKIIFTALDDIVVQESKPFLDLAVVNTLWEQWGFSNAFVNNINESGLSTSTVAKILTINRCVCPYYPYSIPQWAHTTALSELLGQCLEKLDDEKIYYELGKIAQNQDKLEDHLFRITYDRSSYRFVYYYLFSSYFVGTRCECSGYGRSKDKQLALGILINNKGYPFKLDVYPGNTAEVDTLVNNVDIHKRRFKLSNITMVFDQGSYNLEHITHEGLKYISALDKDQIPHMEVIDLSIFNALSFENLKEHFSCHGFASYDEVFYFKDLGIIDNRRYILGFNPLMFKEEKECRNEKIAYFEDFLLWKNKELQNAGYSRDFEATKQAIINELRQLKIKKYFHDPVLYPIAIKRRDKKGKTVIINSFRAIIEKKQDKIDLSNKLDGVCILVSNHTEKVNGSFVFPAKQIIKAYLEKTKIEDGFKSFLKICPFYINTYEHIRAVYTIGVLAYFLNKDLSERRKKIEGVDYLNTMDLYGPFRHGQYITLRDESSNTKKSEPSELSWEQKQLLKKMGIHIHMPSKVFSL